MNKTFLAFLFLLLFSCIRVKTPNIQYGYGGQTAGKSANDLLSGQKYSAIVLEVQCMDTFRLDSAVQANIVQFLSGLCNKPKGITIVQSQLPANGTDLSLDAIKAIEVKNRTKYTLNDTIAIYILVTDGMDDLKYSRKVAGVSYFNTSIVLFGKMLSVYGLTIAVQHELGHLLGLVNCGSSMVNRHEDTFSLHCNNSSCLMYAGPTSSKLDSNCLMDLKANGGK